MRERIRAEKYGPFISDLIRAYYPYRRNIFSTEKPAFLTVEEQIRALEILKRTFRESDRILLEVLNPEKRSGYRCFEGEYQCFELPEESKFNLADSLGFVESTDFAYSPFLSQLTVPGEPPFYIFTFLPSEVKIKMYETRYYDPTWTFISLVQFFLIVLH